MPVPDGYRPTDTRPDSDYLRAEDFPLDKKWKLTIADINIEEMPDRDGKGPRKKLLVSFAGKEKGLLLNATNQSFLEARLGEQPNRWIQSEVVLHRTTTLYAGKTVPAFRIIEAKLTTAPEREPGEDAVDDADF